MKYAGRRFLISLWDAIGLVLLGFTLGLLACGLVRALWPRFFL